MELIKHYLPNDFTIADMSDFHLGSPNCSENTLQETVEKIRTTRHCFVIFKGDAIEAILPGDKRFKHTCVKSEYATPKKQADAVIQIFEPIKERILVWMIGNHEFKLFDTMDFGKYIADALDVPYGAYVCKVAYHSFDTGELMFKTFHTHGMGSVNSNAKDDIQYDANRQAALKLKLSKCGIGDCIYMSRGHDHQLITVNPTIQNKLYLTDDGTQIHQHWHVQAPQNTSFIPENSRWYATTGSFMKLYSEPGSQSISYGEMAGYAPSVIGYVQATVENGQFSKIERVIA